MEIDLREKQGRCRWRKNWRQYSVYKTCIDYLRRFIEQKIIGISKTVEIATKKYCCVVVGYQ